MIDSDSEGGDCDDEYPGSIFQIVCGPCNRMTIQEVIYLIRSSVCCNYE